MSVEAQPVRSREAIGLAAALLLALCVRAAFLAAQGTPPFDHWRHLLLVANLRAGRGFTLFDGQRYVWYAEAWYRLCAWAPRWLEPAWVAGLLSAATVPMLWAWLRRAEPGEAGRRSALLAALLAAGFGPLVAYSCHEGAEAFALFLLLSSLALAAWRPEPAAACAAGLLAGTALAARLNFAFDLLLFLPHLAGPSRLLPFAAGALAPLAAAWWRNHQAIAAHPYLFTWDGLATRSADFGPLSTLVLQLHPAVREGLRRLHGRVLPSPEWLFDGHGFGDGVAWGPLLFLVGGFACLLASRRLTLILSGAASALYFLALDGSHSSRFFRIWLGLFPVLLAAIALAAERLGRSAPGRRWLGWAVVSAALATGLPFLAPRSGFPIEQVTAPPGLLQEDAYFVNSGFEHPEGLAWRHPDKRFAGLPVDPAQVADLLARYPAYRCVLWHDFSVQNEVLAELLGPAGFRAVRSGRNADDREYTVLCPRAR